ncbi:hypothetical protein SAMN05216289_105114 [Dokdonella immobilis]|uniref:Transposase n=1 Tax=Dokdonella immobilis TaxID=578942 RepID=A0A1I4WME0_9GAMM|nr:hypothetical protein SAMN05216289_105114 [Dokdonella immobilis]
MWCCSREALNKWRNRHDTCLRADRDAPAQTDWPSLKSAQQRAARKQASPKRLIRWMKGVVQKARQRHRAARQDNQPSLRHALRLASLLNAMTIAPLVQSLPSEGLLQWRKRRNAPLPGSRLALAWPMRVGPSR